MQLRTRIKYLRLLRGWSRETLAEHAACSPKTIGKFERTGVPPYRSDVAQRLADALGVKVADLYAKNPDEADPLSFAAVA